jgi:uncharacterized protein YndB with AHSA1/START domain
MAGSAAAPAPVVSIYIRATPDAIWRALTESGFTTRYCHGNTVESDWRPGSRYRFRDGGVVAIEDEILESDPPRRLVTTFTALWDEAARAAGASRVAWEVEDSDVPGVCRLTVTHDQLDGKAATSEQVVGGWPSIVSGLKTLHETLLETLLETGHGLG